MPAQILPLTSAPNQSLSASLNINGGTVTLQIVVTYNEMGGFWVLSISNQAGVPILNSVPLITGAYPGANILAPYQYLEIGSAYVINTSGLINPDFPDETDLGANSSTGDFSLLWSDNTN